MTSSRKAGLSTTLLFYLGIFTFVPVWDIYTLVTTIRTGWRSRAGQKTWLLSLPAVRRLIMLLGAAGLATVGIGVLQDWIVQPGPFGLLITGLRKLSNSNTSQVISPGVPVGELIRPAFSNSLWLFLLTSLCIGLFSALLTSLNIGIRRIANRNKFLYRALNLLLWTITGSFAAPAGAISLLIIHVAAIRIGIIPADYSAISDAAFAAGICWLLIPAAIIALFPALISTRAGLACEDTADLQTIAAAVGRGFLDQAGWIISSLIVVEMIFGIPGLGRLTWEAIRLADAPVLAGTLKISLLLILLMRARSAIITGAQTISEIETPPVKPQFEWGRAVVVGIFLLIIVGALVLPLTGSAGDPQHADLAAIYARRSPSHLLGTDHLGRDVFSRVIEALRATCTIALSAGLVAATFGSTWGLLAAWTRKQHNIISAWLSDLILLPAEAAILLHPVLLVLAFRLTASGESVSIAGMGVLIGLALVPRTVWLIGSQNESERPLQLSFNHLLNAVTAIFAMATFISLLYSVSVNMLGSGVMVPTASAGNLLSHFGELIGSEISIHDGRFIRLVVYLSLPGVIASWGGYLIQDFLVDKTTGKRDYWLPRMLS